MVSESCCPGCKTEFDSVEDMQQHQFNTCPDLYNGSIATDQSNSESGSSSWTCSTVLSPTGTNFDPGKSSTTFTSISSITSVSSPQSDQETDPNVDEVITVSPSKTEEPSLNSSQEAKDLIDIYFKYVYPD